MLSVSWNSDHNSSKCQSANTWHWTTSLLMFSKASPLPYIYINSPILVSRVYSNIYPCCKVSTLDAISSCIPPTPLQFRIKFSCKLQDFILFNLTYSSGDNSSYILVRVNARIYVLRNYYLGDLTYRSPKIFIILLCGNIKILM